jgi:hypothetical protein
MLDASNADAMHHERARLVADAERAIDSMGENAVP